MSAENADVIVIGDGVIGLSTAFELGRGGVRCSVFGAVNHGAASGAAAGLLAPSIGKLRPDVKTFFDASLALYPAWVDELRQYEPELTLLEGLLDVSFLIPSSPSAIPKLIPSAPSVIPSAPSVIPSAPSVIPSGARDRFLSADDVSRLEPGVSPRRAVFYPNDGAIDNGLLVRALRRAVASSPSCTLSSDDPVISIDLASGARIRTQSGAVHEAERLIIAAGAWSPHVTGLPRQLPVVPLKGQMLAVRSTALQHAVMGDAIYLVPRRDEIVIGATAEHAGFDTTVAPESIEALRRAAIELVPALADAPITRTWAGIRPATPDMLPILGPDPSSNRLLYACGHSKNGILLAPATAISIAALATGDEVPLDVSPFSVRRFLTAE